MKCILVSAALTILVAGAASAQTTTVPGPAPTPAPTSTSAAQAHAALTTAGTPIEDLIADPAARAIVEKHLPSLTGHPAYAQFKAMTLKAIMPFSGGVVTEEALTAIDEELAALPHV